VKKAPCAIGAKHAREKPFPRNPPSNMPKRNLNESVLIPGPPFCGHGTAVREQVKKTPCALLGGTCQREPKTHQERRPKET
jgi:hypothetical protein